VLRTPRALLLVALLTTSGLLAACGDDGEDGASDDPAVSSTTATTADPAALEGGAAGPDAIEVTGAIGEKPAIALNDAGAVTELYTEDVIVGDGDEVREGDTVEVQYVGVQLDGTQFDASWDSGQTATFPLDQVIPGWTQGIPGMKVGGRRLLVIPGDLAYGSVEEAAASGRPGGTLVFAVDVVSIPEHAPVPIDVVGDGSGVVGVTGALEERPVVALNSAAPATELVSEDIIEGDGAEVTETSTLTVQYLGVLLDGTVFDATWDRGAEPATFPLSGVIQGWRQGLLGMHAGGRRLLVVPPALAYGSAGNGPIGPDQTLVFVVDVLEVGG
jgi:peptidylprolyl isomerase